MYVAETDRLTLAKVTLKDAPFFLELMNSPKWIQFIGDRKIRSIKDAENHLNKTILKCYSEHGFGHYGPIQLEWEDAIGGISGLVKRKELEDVDIGFGFLPGYEGKGYGFESAVEVLKLAKEKFNLPKVCAITMPVNTNSIHLIEKLGLVYQKRIKPFEDDEELMLFALKL